MSRVILQPTGNKDAREHYQDTLVKPVPLDTIQQYVTKEEYGYLEELYPNRLVPTWGVTAGVKNVNKKKWDKINPSDITFFSANKVLYSYAFVTFKIHNINLAEKLWGVDNKNQTWEYIYFLDELREHNIPQLLFNKLVGYSENFIIQGFNVLDEEKSNKLLAYFELQSNIVFQPTTEKEYVEIVAKFDSKSLDVERASMSRREQAFLRKSLFGNKTIAECGICGKKYPTSFIVAAHIKKRAFCTNEEKLDYKNIVIPMCKFGCDDLYEKGYITLMQGVIKINKKLTTEHLNDYLVVLQGKRSSYWNTNNEKYFEWHRHHHSKSKVR